VEGNNGYLLFSAQMPQMILSSIEEEGCSPFRRWLSGVEGVFWRSRSCRGGLCVYIHTHGLSVATAVTMDKGEGIASMDWPGRAVELYHDERELVWHGVVISNVNSMLASAVV
jgi:hypothetical protein